MKPRGENSADNIFPWDEAMRIGFGVLNLSPSEFWSLSPREFEAALTGLYGKPDIISSPNRGSFEALMKAFPD